MRALLWILLALWTLFSWYYYVCKIKHSCWEDSHPSSAISTTPTKPLKFRWSSYQIPLDSGFPELRAAILASKKEGHILHITGQYFLPESNPQADHDLGMARAIEVKKMLIDEIPEDQIKIFTALASIEDVPPDSLIEAIQFKWVEAPLTESTTNQTEEITTTSPPPATSEEVEKDNETTATTDASVVDGDYFLKYFPSNLSDMPNELTDFLDQLATRIIAEDKTVIIRGHTDSVGDKETNFKVGLRRAKKIRDQLIQRGVAKKSINPTSEGEDKPIADNKTKEGRQQNRRIEIILE